MNKVVEFCMCYSGDERKRRYIYLDLNKTGIFTMTHTPDVWYIPSVGSNCSRIPLGEVYLHPIRQCEVSTHNVDTQLRHYRDEFTQTSKSTRHKSLHKTEQSSI
jgi:hypothetical protein